MASLLRYGRNGIRPLMASRGGVVVKGLCLTSTFTTRTARRLKETDRDHPDLAETYEKHKQEQLRKQKEGKGEWTPELASPSEEAVVADRHGHKDHSEKGMRDLQRETAGHAEEKSKK